MRLREVKCEAADFSYHIVSTRTCEIGSTAFAFDYHFSPILTTFYRSRTSARFSVIPPSSKKEGMLYSIVRYRPALAEQIRLSTYTTRTYHRISLHPPSYNIFKIKSLVDSFLLIHILHTFERDEVPHRS